MRGFRTSLVFSLVYAAPNPQLDDTIGDGLDLNNLPVTSTVTSNLADTFWGAFRSSLANRLILETTLSPDFAYQQIYNFFPENGNCWCYLDKHQAGKGATQGSYDQTCKEYHDCIHCGEFQGENAILNQGMDVAFTIDLVNLGQFTPSEDNFNFADLYNYDAATKSMTVNSWSCSENNTGAAMSICQCFKNFEERFTAELLRDLTNTADPENGIEFSYQQTCAHVQKNPLEPAADGTIPDPNEEAEGDCPECPPDETESDSSSSDPAGDDEGDESDPTGSDSAETAPSAHVMADACCGTTAPDWFLYRVFRGFGRSLVTNDASKYGKVSHDHE